MADQYGKVAYMCNWCGQNFHEIPDDRHSMAPMAIYNDYEGNQYCSVYCRDMVIANDAYENN